MSSGNGMVIHSERCESVRHLDADSPQLVYLSWAKDITDDFSVELRVETARKRGLIAELANTVTLAEANLEGINVDEYDARHSVVIMTLHVRGRTQLARIMRRIRNLRTVKSVTRVRR